MLVSGVLVSATVLLQLLTGVRATYPNNEVLVAYADHEVASAVGAFNRLPIGSLRLHVYTVYRNGTPLSDGRTPAYSDEVIDFDCQSRTFRLLQSSFLRPNADTIETWKSAPLPVSVAGDAMRERQLNTVCGTEARVQYGNYFLFMEAYGLNDGREPRSLPGPMVR